MNWRLYAATWSVGLTSLHAVEILMDWDKGGGTIPLEVACASITKVHCQVDRYIDSGEVLKLFGYVVLAMLTSLLLLMVSTAVRLLTRMVSCRLAMWDCTLGELVSWGRSDYADM